MQAYIKGTTSRDVAINHGVPQGSHLSPILYLIFTHDLPPTSKVFRSILADDQKYFVAGPNLSIITTKLQQSMDDLAVYGNQWRIGLNAGKTSKLLFQRSSRHLPDWHYTARPSALSPQPSFLESLSTPRYPSPNTSMLSPTLIVLFKLLSLSTSTYGPSPSTTIRLLNTYIRTLLEYGSSATCVANPSRFVQWERLQLRLITKSEHTEP